MRRGWRWIVAAVVVAVLQPPIAGGVFERAYAESGAVLPANCVQGFGVVLCTFTYNGTNGTDGSVQSFVVPPGVSSVVVDAWGAQGGSFAPPPPDVTFVGENAGGLGGHAGGTLQVEPGQVLDVNVGGHPVGSGAGYGGGGTGFAGGGGASDIRLAGDALADRVIVAGGGGGVGAVFDDVTNGIATFDMWPGGSGGGPAGGDGACLLAGAQQPECGHGGTASAGGAGGASACIDIYGGHVVTDAQPGRAGQGGNGAVLECAKFQTFDAAGGGGGLYGGGGGGMSVGAVPVQRQGAGGGGSGYVSPSATNARNESGIRAGHGLVTVAYVVPAAVYTSTYTVSEVPWLYVDALFLHEGASRTQHDATTFLAYLADIIRSRSGVPPVFGTDSGTRPVAISSGYTSSENTAVLEAAKLFSTDVPTLQRRAVGLLAFLVSLRS